MRRSDSWILAVCAVATATVTALLALTVGSAFTPILLVALPIVFGPLVRGLWRGRPSEAAAGGGVLLLLAAVAASGPVASPAVVALTAGVWSTAGLSHLSLVSRVDRGAPTLTRSAVGWFCGLSLSGLLVATVVVGVSPSLPERTLASDAAAAFAFLAVLVVAASRSTNRTDARD